jgi:hypothetical protein
MEQASNAAEIFLVPIDPTRGLQKVLDDLERLTKLDPKLGAAMDLLGTRLNTFTGEAQETVGAVLWAYARNRMQQGGLAGFRSWLDDGGSVLATVETALGSVFSRPVLNELLQHGTELAASDSPSTGELRQALHEVRQFLSTDSALVVGFLLGTGAAALYLMEVEGYTLNPPAPPPPPPAHLKAEHPTS